MASEKDSNNDDDTSIGTLPYAPGELNPDLGTNENPLAGSRKDGAAGKIYILLGNTLSRLNLDGSQSETVRSDLSADSNYLALDPASNTAYITDWKQNGQIRRTNMDGTGSVENIHNGQADGGQGIALDVSAGKVYWGEYYHGVFSGNIDGSGSYTRLVDAAKLTPGNGQRGQLQVDVPNQHIYFRTAQNGLCGNCPGRKIWRVNFNGDNLTPLYQVGNGDALALDLASGKMYFADGPPVNSQPNSIMRADLTGSNPEELLTLTYPYRYIMTIALDTAQEKMYFTVADPDSGWQDWAVMRSNLDGSGMETLYRWTGSGHTAIALDIPTNQPPNCSKAQPSQEKLWPPNHKFVPIDLLGVTDPDNDDVELIINSILQDEPVDAPGSGSTSPDGQGVWTSTAQVRAERVGDSNGRVYHIGFTANDGRGGTCTEDVLVTVPHNKKSEAVDDGALYDSTAP